MNNPKSQTPWADSIMNWIWGFDKRETGKEYFERKQKEKLLEENKKKELCS